MPLPTNFMDGICGKCKKHSSSYRLVEGIWLCRHCRQVVEGGFYFKEMGVENPADPKGSTAHVRDIKARRFDVKTKETYYNKSRTAYFFPKGKQ